METIKLDLIPGKKMPSLHASQYDDGRDYHIDLTENRVPYVLDGTETISLTVRKCDNTLVTMDIANTFADKSYIEFRTTEQMNACAGFNYGEITIEKNGTRIGSLNFYLQVEGAPDEGGITSQSEINNLARQVHDAVVEELEDNGAEETGYDNTESGLEATNVQDAIDEVNDKADVSALATKADKSVVDALSLDVTECMEELGLVEQTVYDMPNGYKSANYQNTNATRIFKYIDGKLYIYYKNTTIGDVSTAEVTTSSASLTIGDSLSVDVSEISELKLKIDHNSNVPNNNAWLVIRYYNSDYSSNKGAVVSLSGTGTTEVDVVALATANNINLSTYKNVIIRGISIDAHTATEVEETGVNIYGYEHIIVEEKLSDKVAQNTSEIAELTSDIAIIDGTAKKAEKLACADTCITETNRADVYNKTIPLNVVSQDAKVISVKGNSYKEGGQVVMLTPTSLTSYDSDGTVIDSIDFSAVVTSGFGGKMLNVFGITDEINFNTQKAIKRCKAVTINDLSWTYVEENPHNLFRASISDRMKRGKMAFIEDYAETNESYSSANFPDDSYLFQENSGYVYIRDDSYNTAEAFKTAKGSLNILYALADYVQTDISLQDSIKIVPNGKVRVENVGAIATQSEIDYLIRQIESQTEIVTGDCLSVRNDLPTYYTEHPDNPDSFDDDSYMDVKIESIPDGKNFIFFTDTHWDWGNNKKHSPLMIQYVRKRTGINNVIFGGDFINRADDKYLARQVLGDFAYMCLSSFGEGFLPVMGNHDTNIANWATQPDVATKYMPYSITQKVMFNNLPDGAHTQYEYDKDKIALLDIDTEHQNELEAFLKLQYYYDDDAQKIRYIVLDSGTVDYGHIKDIFGSDQESRISMDWLYYALLNTPEGYDVVLTIHMLCIAYTPRNMQGTNMPNYGFPALAMGLKTKSLKEIYYTQVSSTNENMAKWYPHTRIAYDFTKANNVGKVFFVTGHSHCDGIGVITQDTTYKDKLSFAMWDGTTTIDQTVVTNNNGCPIPVIYTTTDAYARYTDGAEGHQTVMTENTITEQAFDVFSLREGEVRMTRFGAGDDRVMHITS